MNIFIKQNLQHIMQKYCAFSSTINWIPLIKRLHKEDDVHFEPSNFAIKKQNFPS